MLLAVVVIVVVASPVLFSTRVFEVDTTNFMWLGSVANHSLAHGLPPTFFLNTNAADASGIFNPVFTFYGGPLFMFYAFLIRLSGGNVTVGLDVLVVLAFAAAYGGTAWLSRLCGVPGLWAHVPAIAVVTAPYFLSNLYGRGDIPEFVALAVIPLLVAGASHAVVAESFTPGRTALLVLATIIFTGSHNLTLLWGVLIGLVVLVVLAVVLRPRGLPIRRLGATAGVLALATLVNAWYLLPDVALNGTTQAAKAAPTTIFKFRQFESLGLIFNPFRSVPPGFGSPALYVQAPVWFLAWAVACGIGLWVWRAGSLSRLRNAWTAVAILLAGLFALIVTTTPWRGFPAPLKAIQFPYRLNGYVVFLVGGLVLLGVMALQQWRTIAGRTPIVSVLIVALAGVSVMSVGLAVWQAWVPESCPPPPYRQCVSSRSAGLTSVHQLPTTWYAGSYYADVSEPVLTVEPGRVFEIAPENVDAHGDRVDAIIDPPAGTEPFVTNIMAGPDLVAIGGGIERVGRTQVTTQSYSDTFASYAVVRRVEPGDGPIEIVLELKQHPSIVAGRVLSVMAVVGVALVLTVPTWRRRRRAAAGIAAA